MKMHLSRDLSSGSDGCDTLARGLPIGGMTGALFKFALLLVVACPSLIDVAHSSTEIKVKRTVQTAATRRAGRAPALPGTAVMQPADVAAQEARLRLARAFPQFVSAPGVDRSSSAMRRRGWHATPSSLGLGRRGARASVEALAPDTLRVAFIRVDFRTDRGGTKSTGDGHFDLSSPGAAEPPIDRPPHDRPFFLKHLEACSRYFDAQSYGRVRVEGDVWPRSGNGAYTVSDMADFGPWRFSQAIYPQAAHMFRTMLFAADSQSIALGDRIPWDSYDRFVVIHAGSDLQDDIKQDSPEDIPTFTMFVADTDAVTFPDSANRPIDRCTFVPELIAQDGYFGAINGAIAHETCINFFGLDDTYNVIDGLPVVGVWDIMDSGNLVGSIVTLPDGTDIYATGFLPPSIDPWQRQFVGDALSFPEVTDGDTIPIQDSERVPDVRKVPLSSDEYLLLENRHVAPSKFVEVDQDSATTVILGPKEPDRFEYDALLPGSGILVWHIDESVVPYHTSLRANPDYSLNTDPDRLAISIIQGDGLEDIGDPNSPSIMGGPYNPFYLSNNAVLSDTTEPNLIPHIGTRPHQRIDFLDDPADTMHVICRRAWQLPGWPVVADFPPGGPQLLAVDADGDGETDVCWAGGAESIVLAGQLATNPDKCGLFAVRPDGAALTRGQPTYAFAHLDQRPYPIMAALPTGNAQQAGPSLFAACTYATGPDTTLPGGRVWLLDWQGVVQSGWPARLPSIVTTPPVIAGTFPNALVAVGCADGLVYALALDGRVAFVSSPALPGGIVGRLAVSGTITDTCSFNLLIAAGGGAGDVALVHAVRSCGATAQSAGSNGGAGTGDAGAPGSWVRRVGWNGFAPDFLWLDFDGATPRPVLPTCRGSSPQLVAHAADKLWVFCPSGELLWSASGGDTLTDALGAGDPDGDGYPKVLTQTRFSGLAFWNVTGHPSPGWPKPGTTERLDTFSPPLAIDVDGDGRTEVVGLNGSGILAAFRCDATIPPGWPLATGSGCAGSPLAADLDGDGTLDIVAPDRFGMLYAYSLPGRVAGPVANSWTMLGGDPGRTSCLPPSRTSTASAPVAGPLVMGSLKTYPNPARLHPVSFAYRLTEPATVEFRVFDTSGHEVASFAREGVQGENVQVWDPGGLPAGLYLARMRFRGAVA